MCLKKIEIGNHEAVLRLIVADLTTSGGVGIGSNLERLTDRFAGVIEHTPMDESGSAC